MERVKKNFGFGCMRLPMNGSEVDIPETKRMVDAFLDAGFNYFDTAHGYIQGRSETAFALKAEGKNRPVATNFQFLKFCTPL